MRSAKPGNHLNRTHHVFSDTGILEFDRNVSSGSNNRGRYVGNIAKGKKEKYRTFIFFFPHPLPPCTGSQ